MCINLKKRYCHNIQIQTHEDSVQQAAQSISKINNDMKKKKKKKKKKKGGKER